MRIACNIICKNCYCYVLQQITWSGAKHIDTTLQSIIEIALQQGIWAALYIYLFFRMLKENAERETQYQQMIHHLSTNVVDGIADINDKLDDMARRLAAWLKQSVYV